MIESALTVEQVSRVSEDKTVEQFDYPSVAAARDGSVWSAWQGYHDRGDHVYALHSTGPASPVRLTDEKADIFRTAIGEDAGGRVWVVWSQRFGAQWDLVLAASARPMESSAEADVRQSANIFHRLVSSRNGALHLVWVGHDSGASHVYWSKLEGAGWSQPKAISGPSAWHPEAAVDSQNNLWVTWDSYRASNCNIFLPQIGSDGIRSGDAGYNLQALPADIPQSLLTKKAAVWLAWDEANTNWGKDWTHDDPNRGTVLYESRRPESCRSHGYRMETACDRRYIGRTRAIPALRAVPAYRGRR